MTGYGSLLETTRNTVRAVGIRPSRRLGQNFVVDPTLLERMVEEASVHLKDDVLEIGGGTGSLTESLARGRPRTLTVMEKDRRLATYLRSRFSGQSCVKVMEGDYLKASLPAYGKCVSNPPFGISSKVVLKLIDEAPSLIVITFERGYAQRLTSTAGEREYGRLSIMLQLNYEVQEIGVFPNTSFFPPPSTKISLLRMDLKPDRIDKNKALALQRVTSELFRYRRKRVIKALKMSSLPKGLSSDPRLERLLDKRVFDLSPDDLLMLSKIVRGERM